MVLPWPGWGEPAGNVGDEASSAAGDAPGMRADCSKTGRTGCRAVSGRGAGRDGGTEGQREAEGAGSAEPQVVGRMRGRGRWGSSLAGVPSTKYDAFVAAGDRIRTPA